MKKPSNLSFNLNLNARATLRVSEVERDDFSEAKGDDSSDDG